jgi:uncharacterized protein (DUF1697 family)
MERRVALVRALNVGGTGVLRMERLRALAEGLGWRDVATLGASGNVLYTPGRASPATDAARLAQALEEEMGRPSAVLVRTPADLQAILAAQPFASAPPGVPSTWWFVGFVAAPAEGALPEVPPGGPLAYAGRLPREVCWTMAAPDRRAIDLPKRIEKAWGVAMTVRNWNVVQRLAAGLGPRLR